MRRKMSKMKEMTDNKYVLMINVIGKKNNQT